MTDVFYLDHAAATPVDRRVILAMEPYQSELFYNPSSPYLPAVQVRRDYEDAKTRLAGTFGAKGSELVVTAGATESINLAFSGITGHVVTSTIEHPAVLKAAEAHEASLVAPTEKGIVEPSAVARAITADTELVSIQLANNELGTIQPVRDIAHLIKDIRRSRLSNGNSRQLLLHCDASQGFGLIDVHTSRLGIDLLTINSAKIYGPKQVGLLWVRPGVQVAPMVVGGGQERGLRSGTENVAGTVGFAKAAELVTRHRDSESVRIAALRDAIQNKLEGTFENIVISGHPKKRLANSLHVSFPGLDAERLVFALESRSVLIATGSACAANKGTRSHVLEAVGMDPSIADSSLRLTLGALNDATSCEKVVTIIIEVVKKEYERVAARA